MNATSLKWLAVSVLLVGGCGTDQDTQQDVSGAQGSGHGSGSGSGTGTPTAAKYKVTELVTSATDPQLVNPWGIVGAEGVFWIADEKTGHVSVYDGNGKTDARYPTGALTPGIGITGLTRNANANAFLLSTSTDCNAAKTPAEFIFASVTGKLIATNDFTSVRGVDVVDRSAAGAIYLGVTIVDMANGPVLLAADFGNGRLDMFDTSFKLITPSKAFIDPETPAGYGPFNVLAIGDTVFVMYAKMGAPGEEEKGVGLGRVTLFNTKGDVIGRLKSNSFNAPWGVTVAESASTLCGDHSTSTRTILVGNFGDGRIEQFNATTFASMGQLADDMGRPIAREGLWGIAMGSADAGNPNSLYFVQGNQAETAGIFGRIDRL